MGVAADTLAGAVRLPRTLTRESIGTLLADLRSAASGPAHVTLLVGGEGVFCEGLDLNSVGPEVGAAMQCFVDVLIALAGSPKPTLAVVEGNAHGGGLGIMCACDVAVAADSARFALPEALYGFLPAAIYPLLTERLPAQKIRLLVVDGASRDAAWALQHGLVDELIDPASLPRAVRGWTRRLQRTGSGGAVPGLRALCRRNRATDLERSIRDGAAETVAALAGADLASRLRAFAAEGLAPWAAS